MDPQRLQILVATADDQVLEDLRDALNDAAIGAEILPAEGPVTDTSDEVRVDFLFVDVDLGRETAEEVLAGQDADRVPVVALASDEAAAIELFRDHRLHDILRKPLDPAEVHRVLSYYDEV